MKTLSQALRPRESVFDKSVRDTVYNIDDLATIDPAPFFAENFITQGMRQLLTEAFSRLEGKSQNAPGAFLLSQAMGGGKTHNLIALGLLAKHPAYRQQVMGDFYQCGPLGQVRVVTFSGRKTHTPFGIWGELAGQLNRHKVFEPFYSPLNAPGYEDWIELLRGDPVLILLDELPPHFQNARAIEVGSTTLDQVTTTALSNLLVAVASDKLPNACAVLTDLSGTAYALGSESVSSALRNLELEANRSVQRIDPVRLNSDEFYSILRTRLFQELPDEHAIEEIADGYQAAIDVAQRTDLTTASPRQVRTEILKSYPFHPGIRDLYARFRENQGFQQTRALIRLMRMVAAGLWTSNAADRLHLIGAHNLDFHDADMLNEVRQINRTLDNAIAHDVAEENRGAIAEQIDGPHGVDAQDAAKLIFMSSLSTAVNPTLGLTRSDIVAYLAAPGRDLTTLTKALDRLQAEAWYVHATHTGSLLFKNVENLNAKLESYAKGASREEREKELRARLEEMFRPKIGHCYQEVKALPALDQVQLTPDRVTLVVMRPDAGGQDEMRRFYDAQQFKNRVLFLTSREAEYQPVLDALAYLRAISAIINEFRNQGMREADLQLKEALEIKTKREASFYIACREAFQTIYYPSRNGLTEMELDPKYVSNQYEGETQIAEALFDTYKFKPDATTDTAFRNSIENKLWPEGSKEASWNEIRRRAAQDPSWSFHHPKALDDVKEEMLKQEQWKDLTNGFVQKGPFPKPPAGATIQQLHRDEKTGKVRLRVVPRHADRVRVSEDGPATSYSALIDGWEFETDKVRVSFLPEDSSGDHDATDPIVWTNTIEVKYQLFQDGDQRRCELKAIPTGQIKYTTDGANPSVSGLAYDGPFVVPKDTRVILAIASEDGVTSNAMRVDVPAGPIVGPTLDPKRPAIWKPTKPHKMDDTAETFAYLEQLATYHAWPGGIRLVGTRDDQWWEITTDEGSNREPEKIRELASTMREIFHDRNITLDVETLQFSRGQDLLDLVAALKTELKDGEVKQHP